MKTIRVNFEGCNQEVIGQLRKGKGVFCKLFFDRGSITEYGNVMAYISGADHPYISEDGHGWDSVEIVDCNEFVKKASEIVKWLEDNEYQVDRDGNWENGDSLAFGVRMFFYCGKKKCDDYTWLEEWIEELPILS